MSGKWWAHEHWGLETPPDIVTFAKKMQSAGFYYRSDMNNNWGPTIFNTFVGDPARLVLLDAILTHSKEHNLMENARLTGSFIKRELMVRFYKLTFSKSNFTVILLGIERKISNHKYSWTWNVDRLGPRKHGTAR